MKPQLWLDHVALAVLTAPIMYGFFAFVNLFLIGYIEWQDHSPHPFDAYPFTFLNLILAIFSVEMSIIIVIAQIIASYRTDAQDAQLISGMQKMDLQTGLLLETMQNNVAMMQELEEMGRRELERDTELHASIKEGHIRLAILEKLLLTVPDQPVEVEEKN